MNNIGFSAPSASSAAFAVNPASKPVVGLEDTDTKQDIFSAVEETSEISAGKPNPDSKSPISNGNSQSEQQQQQLAVIQDLANRDREVRAHEQAHASVGGKYAGAASFTYQRGPDGVSYAVGGEVSISSPTGGDPQTRLQAAEQIKRAALAPANPSAQDRRVAVQAGLTATQARTEIASLKSEERATSKSEESIDKVENTAAETADSKNTTAEQAFKNITNASDVGAVFNQLA